jgi:hypothetical protein
MNTTRQGKQEKRGGKRYISVTRGFSLAVEQFGTKLCVRNKSPKRKNWKTHFCVIYYRGKNNKVDTRQEKNGSTFPSVLRCLCTLWVYTQSSRTNNKVQLRVKKSLSKLDSHKTKKIRGRRRESKTGTCVQDSIIYTIDDMKGQNGWMKSLSWSNSTHLIQDSESDGDGRELLTLCIFALVFLLPTCFI